MSRSMRSSFSLVERSAPAPQVGPLRVRRSPARHTPDGAPGAERPVHPKSLFAWTGLGASVVTENPRISLGQEYSRDDLERFFGIHFGYRIPGIVVRRFEPRSERRLILLFSRSGGVYSDVLSDTVVHYDGSGLRGNQRLAGVNKALAARGPVDGFHLFVGALGSSAWRYLGRGRVETHREITRGGRTMIDFELRLERQ